MNQMSCLMLWGAVLLAAAATLEVEAKTRATETAAETLFFQDTPPVSELNAAVGQNIVIRCKIGGNFSPTIRWLYNGVPIRKVSSLPLAS